MKGGFCATKSIVNKEAEVYFTEMRRSRKSNVGNSNIPTTKRWVGEKTRSTKSKQDLPFTGSVKL